MAASNPFQPATKVSKRLKVLLYGGSGTGKTVAGLSFPRPAVIDSENGTDLYAGRDGVPAFSVWRIKTFQELEKAIEFIKGDNGKTFDTLVIDSISVFYDVQKEAASKTSTSKDNELGYREWAKINNRMVYLYNALTNLPVHVVCVAREAIEYETKGGNLTKVGTKPDADKRLVYMFDFIVRMTGDHGGDVIKSRGASQLKHLPQVNWQAFEKIAGMFVDGKPVEAIDENTAAESDSAAFSNTRHWSLEEGAMKRVYEWANTERGMSETEVTQAILKSGRLITALTKAELKDIISKEDR